MKVAICFSGLTRTFEHCWPSYSKITNRYDCDLFAAAPPGEEIHNRVKYPFKKVLYQQDEWIDENGYDKRKTYPETVVQNSLRQFYYIELANRLRKKYEKDKGIKYDWVIRTRLDNIMTADILHLFEHNPLNLYIPEGHDHPEAHPGQGINDRFAVGGGEVMDVYCEKLKLLNEYMSGSRTFHPETFLKWVLDKNKVPVLRFPECSKIYRGKNELL